MHKDKSGIHFIYKWLQRIHCKKTKQALWTFFARASSCKKWDKMRKKINIQSNTMIKSTFWNDCPCWSARDRVSLSPRDRSSHKGIVQEKGWGGSKAGWEGPSTKADLAADTRLPEAKCSQIWVKMREGRIIHVTFHKAQFIHIFICWG